MLLLYAFGNSEILNGDFEEIAIIVNQSGFADTLADNWSMSDYGAGITSDSYSGKLAIYIWNWYHCAKGMLVNGSGNVFFDGGTPINYIPAFLRGFYKYYHGDNDDEDDSAFAEVLLLNYNLKMNKRDTVAYGSYKFNAVNIYTPFRFQSLSYWKTYSPILF